MREDNSRLLLQAMNTRRPAVHCLTNTVVQALTANMLLAVGAIPSMSTDIAEVADFTAGANALIVNLGTLDRDRKRAIQAALTAAHEIKIPWVLDPVLIDRAPKRRSYAKELINENPALVRGNQAEITALSDNPRELAKQSGAIVAVTGETDFITDGTEEIILTGGHEMMSRVTGIGCAGTALLGACLAAAPEGHRLEAVATGLSLLARAGEEAANTAVGPGSFAAQILDQIYKISQSSLQERKES